VGGSQQTVTWFASAPLCNRLVTGPGAARRGAGDRRVLTTRRRIQKLDFGKRLLSTYPLVIKMILEDFVRITQMKEEERRQRYTYYLKFVERGEG
jgi:hypothetical protein